MSTDDERAEIERELEELRFRQPYPTLESVTAHNDRLAELTRRLQELPKRPEPVTGERAGSVVVGVDRLIGSIPARPFEPATVSDHHSGMDAQWPPWAPRDR